MAARIRCLALFLLQLLVLLVASSGEDVVGTRWAVLIAGSNGYYNYRHQARIALCFHFVPFLAATSLSCHPCYADVCHAYQILKKGGLKDENIIVFMYDDIANNTANPRPGVIINHPNGTDVYAGVPKDYTGEDVNVHNFLAVLLGDKSNLTGGSGKVVNSTADDHVFVYFTDHGGPGVLAMPSGGYLYANDLVDTLKKKHAAGTYKSLVLYVEACESGSMFEGLLPSDMNVYAMTASNANESSFAYYCPGGNQGPSPPPEFTTCLGDLYSIAWMENSDVHNLRNESVHQQYEAVRDRTSGTNGSSSSESIGSHVMEYGDLTQNNQSLYSFIGTNPANDNATSSFVVSGAGAGGGRVDQRVADLVYFWHKYRNAGEDAERREARKRLMQEMARRSQIDSSVELIGSLLFGSDQGANVLDAVRPAGQPVADDWDCLKSLVRTYEGHCGSLGQYGIKHMRAFANICNAGVAAEDVAKVAAQVCAGVHSGTQY
ncbi:hypothetical protein EJB05_36351, partial [Eragrostis curvula]